MIPPQRKAYLNALAEAIHRNLRFLEVVATSPIGLTTDLLSLREAMPVEGASQERDRQAFRDLTSRGADPRPLGMRAQDATLRAIELLNGVAPTAKTLCRLNGSKGRTRSCVASRTGWSPMCEGQQPPDWTACT